MSRFVFLLACYLIADQAYAPVPPPPPPPSPFMPGVIQRQEDNHLDLNGRDNAQRCGGGPSCIDGQASCQGGTCVCNAPFSWGDGTFACYKKSYLAAEVKNDPQVTTFLRETFKFPFLCRYKITHVETELKDKDDNVIGSCLIEVMGFNNRYRGKIFTFGFDVGTLITYNDGREAKVSARTYGILKNKTPYIYTRANNNNHRTNGPWAKTKMYYSDPQNDVSVKLWGKDNNKQVIFEAARCGVHVTFVPYEVMRSKQVRVPGVSVAIDKEHSPAFRYRYQHTAVPPYWRASLLSSQKRRHLTIEQSMFLDALASDTEQNQPYGSPGQCRGILKSLQHCSNPDFDRAFHRCFWILEEPRFMRCYDKTFESHFLLGLVSKCIEAICGVRSCQSVIDEIQDSGCGQVSPKASRFVSGVDCP